jgi:hypothetical protein
MSKLYQLHAENIVPMSRLRQLHAENIVLLPLVAGTIAGIICLVGALNRFPGPEPSPPRAAEHQAAPPPGINATGASSQKASTQRGSKSST